MASIILGSAGAAVGGIFGGPLGSAVGRFAGSTVGRLIDNKLFTSTSHSQSSGPRLRELHIQTSSYGITIPILFGTVRIAGNIIWARPLHEVATTSKHKQSAKGSKVHHNRTEYSYFASFAVSICEGEIDEVIRIFSGSKQLNLSQYNIRTYKGSEVQKPDPLIESFEGVGMTPAFRGQAYIVFENLPLAEFGNCIPNLNFEVRRKVVGKNEQTIQNLVKSVVVIPGGGEYVYDTVSQYKSIGDKVGKKWCPRGKPISLNHHTSLDTTNAVLATTQLQKTLPQLQWVSVVVNWFGTSLDIANCKILPGVEYNDSSSHNFPDPWSVAGQTRSSAYLISKNNGRPNYGGTINDLSLIRYIKHLKSLGYKVMLYPMIFMDLPQKPWRGNISGQPNDIDKFFKDPKGYNNFITHYCTLLKNQVDAIVIGSELKSLTSIKTNDNTFPAVNKFVELAQECRKIVGPNTILTYAADWSEYHHTSGGWYHMDKLWSCPDIDVISIDAYFPLTNSNKTIYDIKEIHQGWSSGEGYDFYYEDATKTCAHPLDKPYAWKNIRWWWENPHVNPDGKQTSWQPKSKKIWFTEYGFPSVDCATNQPNVFCDPLNNNLTYPIHSKGLTDFKAQTNAILATELFWQDSDMVEQKFLWCWDARPYPFWPDLTNVWNDGRAWQKGHWVQGKTSQSSLHGILEELSNKVGLDNHQITFNKIDDNVDGLVIDSLTSSRAIIGLLQKAYQFHVFEDNGQIIFTTLQEDNIESISYSSIAKVSNVPAISIKRLPELELPQKIDVNFLDVSKNYQVSNQHAMRCVTISKEVLAIDLPIVMSEANAKLIAENFIQQLWSERNFYSFYLPPQYMFLKPLNIIKIKYKKKFHLLKIINIQLGKNHLLRIEAINHQELKKPANNFLITNNYNESSAISKTSLQILDLPYLPHYDLNEPYILVGAKCLTDNWQGAAIYTSLNHDSDYTEVAYIDKLAILGHCINNFNIGDPSLIDYHSKIIINLQHGQLFSVNKNDIEIGSNLCKIGEELLQFQNVNQLSDFQYEISTLYRGLFGTQSFVNSHEVGESFTLIDENLLKISIPYSFVDKSYFIKAVTNGTSLGITKAKEFIFKANSCKEISPISLKLQYENDTQKKLSWIRRNRLSSPINDYTDIPSEVKEEKYLVRLSNLNNINSLSLIANKPYLLINNSILTNYKKIEVCQFNNLLKEGFYAILNI